MSSTSFSPDILLSPFISLDQIILSLVYSSDVLEVGQNFSFFLVPESATLYPSSVLGWLYAYLLNNPQISRIVYMRQDEVSSSVISGDERIDYILWKSLFYGKDYYKDLNFLDCEVEQDFYTDSVFRSTHVFYSRFLDNIQLCPIVLPPTIIQDKKIYTWLMSYLQMVVDDPTTVCVFFDSHSFSVGADSQVSINKENLYGMGTIFYDYCITLQKNPHLLQSEFIETIQKENNSQDSYQWIFAF